MDLPAFGQPNAGGGPIASDRQGTYADASAFLSHPAKMQFADGLGRS